MIKRIRKTCVGAAEMLLPTSWMQSRRRTATIFRRIHDQNIWDCNESVSGPGSTLQYTEELRTSLPSLLRRLQIDTLLDLPCGDFGWLGTVELPVKRVIGADIVEALVLKNQATFGNAQREFRVLDLTRDALPPAEMLLCRDCMIHLPTELTARALANICQSQIRYAVMTTYPGGTNREISLGDFYDINLRTAPFNLPAPTESLKDWVPPFAERVLGVWSVAELRNHFARNPLRIGSVYYQGK